MLNSSFSSQTASSRITLGLRANWLQFGLLVLVNALVGAMIGMERSILPQIAEQEFHLADHTSVLSFIIIFGVTKAVTNYFAGRFADIYGRKVVLIAGWFVAIPVPFLLMWAPTWLWILLANVLLGVSQGLAWSTTVIMKIDLVGQKNRGLAMGLNEFAGYFAVGGTALVTGWIAENYGLRPQPFFIGVGVVFAGLVLSMLMVRETKPYAQYEGQIQAANPPASNGVSKSEVFLRTTFLDRNLSSVCQVGMVNNLNDGMAWGLFPLLFTSVGFGLSQIGWLAAIYPTVWGVGQLFMGAISDRVGRKWLIVIGMLLQAIGIAGIATVQTLDVIILGSIFLGVGTAMVYPTLLATIGDVASPAWRASSIGVYRLWRDLGYAAGALVSGLIAQYFGVLNALWLVAGLTAFSGLWAALRMQETLRLHSV
jgi:MFS family permease